MCSPHSKMPYPNQTCQNPYCGGLYGIIEEIMAMICTPGTFRVPPSKLELNVVLDVDLL